jgi:riboflavin synthase
MVKIGIADTCFARVNMGEVAAVAAKEYVSSSSGSESGSADGALEIERYTVPGFKDLPVACKKLFSEYGCDIVVALGWVGGEDIDETCAHEANIGLIQCELMVDRHILKVFFHVKEAKDDLDRQKEICIDRVRKHTVNALKLLEGKEVLSFSAGQGKRQGYDDAGSIE